MKVIRASRGIYVPLDPERPNSNSMRMIPKGVIALIPDEFLLPDEAYQDLGRVNLKKREKKNDDERE